MCLIVFIVLLYLLYQKDEESWVQIEKGRKKEEKKKLGYINSVLIFRV
jgi:hypothetical protein